MSRLSFSKLRRLGGGLALGLLLVAGGGCRPYRMPNPTGPPQPKVKKAANKDEVSADGRSAEATSEIKPIHNNYDRKGLLKKPKYERRRLKKKVGQRKFLGITLPF
ncbi:hypothetical protein E5K00_14860 [Hymenobacter aquaticus]|uniref:Uncharacterized protein n=1 Tax=Hymenobacter aquaticus TaxID=1867101 RepID=A0A4Z0PX99_9BACT|nr:hypothetical protein [Hymenobacter aquaticus]TGE21561.1 hypothetical protein E5K00_14860 [Hymenobacter aquaticus]